MRFLVSSIKRDIFSSFDQTRKLPRTRSFHCDMFEKRATFTGACVLCVHGLIRENKRKRDTKKLVLSFQGSVKTKQCHSHNEKYKKITKSLMV